MFKHIQTKMIVLYALLFIGVQGLTYWAVYDTTVDNLTEQIKQQLVFGRQVMEKQLALRTRDLTEASRVLASDFGFRTAVATDDIATIRSALENLTGRINASNARLLSLEGEIIADTISEADRPENLNDQMIQLLDRAEFDQEFVTMMELGASLQEVVVVPVLAPILIAWIAIGIDINEGEMAQFQQVLPVGIEVSFTAYQPNMPIPRLMVSTLEAENLPALNQTVEMDMGLPSQPEQLSIGQKNYMALEFPSGLNLQNQNIAVLLLYDIEAAFAPYMPLVISLSLLVAVGLMLLIIGSIFVARGVSSPIIRLSHAAEDIGKGHYHTVSVEGQSDEVGQLAESFNQMIVDIQAREDKIRYQAEHDQETMLANRRYFERHLSELIEEQKTLGPEAQTVSVIVVAINRFDEVQNTLGYGAGERMIKHVAEKISILATEASTIARLTTTSFILALVHPDYGTLSALGHRLKGALEETFFADDIGIDVSVLIGASQWQEGDETGSDILIRQANVATLQAQGGLADFTLYDEARDTTDAERLSLMSELRDALHHEGIELYYQPKICLRRHVITHAEVLVRWFHPERGFMNPEMFIALAEQTGHIFMLTEYVLRRSFAQVAQWRGDGYDIVLGINLSARDLVNEQLPEMVMALMAEYHVEASWIVLEVTESAVMDDPALALAVLERLHGLDIPLSIDDYGTGYSSLGYLKALPVQELKIDKSFVQHLASDTDDQILVRSTIQLAQNLGLKVTAEGVEDAATYTILKDMGCDLAQGYHMSRPIPAADLVAFMSQSNYAIKAMS